MNHLTDLYFRRAENRHRLYRNLLLYLHKIMFVLSIYLIAGLLMQNVYADVNIGSESSTVTILTLCCRKP